MAERYLVMTAVGPDQPGLVKEISAKLHAAGCNIEDSRMAILAGEFALILLFSGGDDAVRRAQHELTTHIEQKLAFRVGFKESLPTRPPQGLLRQRLSVSGSDQPGIVHRVSEAVAGLGINVASLESQLRRAAFTGTPLFSLQADLHVPDQATLAQLRANLEQICDALDLAYMLDEIDGPLP